MRVLLWSDYFWPALGGTEVFALNLIRALGERGVEFEVVANRAEAAAVDAEPPVPGLTVHRLPIRAALARGDLTEAASVRRSLTALLARFRPDLVHEISLGPGDVFLHEPRRRAGARCLVTLQQHIPPRMLRADGVIGGALRCSDWIASCSAAVQGELLQSVPEVAGRCSVIHNALPDDDQGPLHPPPAAPRLLCLGRLVEQKGFDVALQAFAAVRAEIDGVRLTIAGDGPQRAELEAAARRLGIRSHVDFLGWVHPRETAALIDSASAVLMPSRCEPMAFVGLEAALRARPLVATRVGGMAEIVVDGETGVLVGVDDVAALAEAVIRLLRNPSAAADFGRRARARVSRLYPWRAHRDAYQLLYSRLCGLPPPARR